MSTRRRFLTSSLVAGANCAFAQTSSEKELLFFPGIMGSELYTTVAGNRAPIWPMNLDELYSIVLTESGRNLIPLPDRAVATQVFNEAYIKILGYSLRSPFYRPLMDYLNSHPTFGAKRSFVPYAYDWRQSLDKTVQDLKSFVNQRYGFDSRSGKPSKRLVLVGHSMGALLLILALGEGVIPAASVDQVILMCPPVLGSARAFFSMMTGQLFDSLPYRLAFYLSKNSSHAQTNLATAIQRLPGPYQLLPPQRIQYLQTTQQQPFEVRRWNPLDRGDNRIDAGLAADARAIHVRIEKAVAALALPAGRIRLFVGKGIPTPTAYEIPSGYAATYQAIISASGFDRIPPLETGDGDGRVTVTSATGDNLLVSKIGSNYVETFDRIPHDEFCTHSDSLNRLKFLIG
jgi:pimeloyl-ACP methyl ester carboxylesterase